MKSKYLFLDRDGVINHKLDNDYVKHPSELMILPKVPEAIHAFRKWFDKIIVITNQQGIGKGLMSIRDLAIVHQAVSEELKTAGAWIDDYYFSPFLAAHKPSSRKPNIGMGLQAKEKYPALNFTQSWMVGDSFSDLEFGKNLGMTTVYIAKQEKWNDLPKGLANHSFESLIDLSAFLAEHFK